MHPLQSLKILGTLRYRLKARNNVFDVQQLALEQQREIYSVNQKHDAQRQAPAQRVKQSQALRKCPQYDALNYPAVLASRQGKLSFVNETSEQFSLLCGPLRQLFPQAMLGQRCKRWLTWERHLWRSQEFSQHYIMDTRPLALPIY